MLPQCASWMLNLLRNFLKCGAFMSDQKQEKSCFVISPIGEAESEVRKRSDQVLKHIIRPAVESRGYAAVRADEIDKPGLITSQVIQHVVSDELVIADLTDRNPNVFYELAIRHALRKPLVQIISKGEPIPFDVAGTRTIYFDHRDLDSVDNARREIVLQIDSLEKDSSDIETPISVSLDLQILRQSEKPEERSIADLVSLVTDVRTATQRIEAKHGAKDFSDYFDQIDSRLKELTSYIRHGFSHEGISPKRIAYGGRALRDAVRYAPEPAENGLLVLAAFVRDFAPWIYEIILDSYRRIKNSRSRPVVDSALGSIYKAIEATRHGPLLDIYGRGSKEYYQIFEEIEPAFSIVAERILIEKKFSVGKKNFTSGPF